MGNRMSTPLIDKVLVVCIGNICRSPMAEGLLKDRMQHHSQQNVEVRSAGISALVGRQSEKFAQRIMLRQGIDISNHRAKQLVKEDIVWAALILVMDNTQRRTIEQDYPSARGKVFKIGEWLDVEVSDPYRQPEAAFESSYKTISRCIDGWVSKIKQE